MKKLLWMPLLALLVLPSCSQLDEPGSNADPQTPSNRAQIGVVEDGEARLTIEPGRLKIAFQQAHGSESADDFHLEEVNGMYFLFGLVHNTDQTRTTFAVALDSDDGNLGFDVYAAKHSCTSTGNCAGCKLTVEEEFAGYCDCIYWEGAGLTGKCKHTVTAEPETLAGDGKRQLHAEDPILASVISYLNAHH